MSLGRRAALAVALTLALLVGAGLLRLLGFWYWTVQHPCWRYSNAAWCGHYCDDDPCACPERHDTADPFGAGPGCPDP